MPNPSEITRDVPLTDVIQAVANSSKKRICKHCGQTITADEVPITTPDDDDDDVDDDDSTPIYTPGEA